MEYISKTILNGNDIYDGQMEKIKNIHSLYGVDRRSTHWSVNEVNRPTIYRKIKQKLYPRTRAYTRTRGTVVLVQLVQTSLY